MEWETVRLGDVAQNIQTGPFGSQLHQADYSDEGIPVVMPKDLVGGHISETSIARVPEEHVNRLSRHKIENGDIIYSRRGDVGRCAFSTKREAGWLCGTGCLRVTIEPSKASPKFIFYQLQKPDTVGWVENHAVGSTMLNLNTSILGNIPVALPPLSTQNRIASILSAYDNLIENNKKQIKLLEEAAQRLYKEWFVDFRFPGHEGVKFVDGVPEGWERVGLGEITPILTGKKDANFGTPNGHYPFFTCAQEPIRAASHSFDCDAVILAGNGEFNVKIYRGKFEAYQRTYVFSPYKKEHLYLLYHAVRDNMRQLFQGASGSTIKFLTKHMLEDILVYVPAPDLMKKYNQQSEAIQRKMECIKQLNNDAQEARDRLLPKLMSGEIGV
ncbi:MAG: restriction endonuclease subunit S [Selenomonadaceae bacterium]|nr:restriction endonuclease subunit S [Selenomonadaceae bacterium]